MCTFSSGYAVPLDHGLPSGFLDQELQSLLALDVIDTHDRIHVHHVVDPGDVFVADALDVVTAVAVPVERGTLDGFEADDLVIGPDLLQAVTGCDRSGGAHRGRVGRYLALPNALFRQLRGEFYERIPRDIVVETVVTHHLELIQHAHLGSLLRSSQHLS